MTLNFFFFFQADVLRRIRILLLLQTHPRRDEEEREKVSKENPNILSIILLLNKTYPQIIIQQRLRSKKQTHHSPSPDYSNTLQIATRIWLAEKT